jgi:uncharacterized NAD(P)/FAD-binding protein YdhS
MPKKIAIIGGGFSGTMVIRQLIDHGFRGTIHRFIRENSETLGPAYKDNSTPLLLNVRNKNMSAFPDDPTHFVRFLEVHFPEDALPNNFVQRSIYGHYLKTIWDETKDLVKKTEIQLQLVSSYQVDYEEYDAIVLATGNELPRIPSGLNDKVFNSPFYQGNPWEIDFESIQHELPIFILGNGLTMVDTVLSLRQAGFQQKIVALSTHGFNMLVHPENEVLTQQVSAPVQQDLHSLVHFFNIQRKGLSHAQFLLLVDSFRPYFSTWWQRFSLDEKKLFISKFRHVWGTIRHRIPTQIAQKINEERISGQLVVQAGKLLSFQENGQFAQIAYTSDNKVINGDFACLINCTGPETDITVMSNPVIKDLLSKQWILPDLIRQGIDIQADTHLALGSAPMKIYAIGNLCKGNLWESTAVGELRAQAKLIAKGILENK